MAAFSSLETWAWDMPISSATSIWVFPWKSAFAKSFFPFVQSSHAFFQSQLLNPLCILVALIADLVHHVNRIAAVIINRLKQWNRILDGVKGKHNFFMGHFKNFGDFLCCRLLLVSLINRSLTWSALYAISRSDLETRIGLLSRKYLRISPMIIGTAYVENLTLWLRSKLSMDFISPMQPTWNKSSTYSPLLLNLWMTLKTRRRLPFTSFSLAESSPSSCNCLNSFLISSFLSTGNLGIHPANFDFISWHVFPPTRSCCTTLSISSGGKNMHRHFTEINIRLRQSLQQ